MDNLFNINEKLLRDATDEEVLQIKNCYNVNLNRIIKAYKKFSLIIYIVFLSCLLMIVVSVTESLPMIMTVAVVIESILCYILGTMSIMGIKYIKKKLSVINKGSFKLLDGKVLEIAEHQEGSDMYNVIFESNDGKYIGNQIIQDKDTKEGNKLKLVVLDVDSKQCTDCFSPQMFSKNDLSLSIN